LQNRIVNDIGDKLKKEKDLAVNKFNVRPTGIFL